MSKTLIWIFIILLLCFSFYHSLILLHFLPYEIIWLDHLKTENDRIFYEVLTLIIIGLLIGTLFSIKHSIETNRKKVWHRPVLNIYFFLFSLNSFGNFFSDKLIERYIFSYLTILFSLIIVYLLAYIYKKNI